MCPEHPIGLVLKDISPLPGNTKKPLCLGLALETGILSVWGYDIGFEVSLDDSNVHPGLRNTVRVQKEGQAYLRSLVALNMQLLPSSSSSCRSLYGWICSQNSGHKVTSSGRSSLTPSMCSPHHLMCFYQKSSGHAPVDVIVCISTYNMHTLSSGTIFISRLYPQHVKEVPATQKCLLYMDKREGKKNHP